MAHILIPRLHWHLRINDGLPFLWGWLSWPAWPLHNLLLIKGVLQHQDSVWEHWARSIHLWHKLSNNALWASSLRSQFISDLAGVGVRGEERPRISESLAWSTVSIWTQGGSAFSSFGPVPLSREAVVGNFEGSRSLANTPGGRGRSSDNSWLEKEAFWEDWGFFF